MFALRYDDVRMIAYLRRLMSHLSRELQVPHLNSGVIFLLTSIITHIAVYKTQTRATRTRGARGRGEGGLHLVWNSFIRSSFRA